MQSDTRDRLVKERNALQKKLDRLVTFLASEAFKTLLPPASDLLVEQRAIMAAYLNVLNSRIYATPPAAAPGSPVATPAS